MSIKHALLLLQADLRCGPRVHSQAPSTGHDTHRKWFEAKSGMGPCWSAAVVSPLSCAVWPMPSPFPRTSVLHKGAGAMTVCVVKVAPLEAPGTARKRPAGPLASQGPGRSGDRRASVSREGGFTMTKRTPNGIRQLSRGRRAGVKCCEIDGVTQGLALSSNKHSCGRRAGRGRDK